MHPRATSPDPKQPAIRAAATLACGLMLTGCSAFGYPQGPPGGAPSSPPSAAAASPPASTAGGRTYEVMGRRYTTLGSAEGYQERGLASWYGEEFRGRPTANGETFDPHRISAAHRTLPLGTWVRVTNLMNGREVVVRVNDRGPFEDPDRRIIDVSYATAQRLGFMQRGTVPVEVRALDPEEARDSR